MRKKLLILLFLALTASVVKAEVTPAPVIVCEEGDEYYTVSAVGNGEVHLYLDWQEVDNPYYIPRGDEGMIYSFMAYAQEQGKEASEVVSYMVFVPAIEPPIIEITPAPVIVCGEGDEYYIVSAEGYGEVRLYLDGYDVENPYYIPRADVEMVYFFMATAQEDGKEMSEVVSFTVYVPAVEPPIVEITPAPEIIVEENEYYYYTTVSAVGNGEVHLYLDGEEVYNPYVIEWDANPMYLTFTATAQEEGKDLSDAVCYQVYVPARPYPTPPAGISTELTDDYLIINANGMGTVTIYVEYIDNETGSISLETTTDEYFATYLVPRGKETFFINCWAVALFSPDALPGISDVLYYVEVPAKVITPVVTPGDVNGDGELGIADVTDLINYLLTGDDTGIHPDGLDCNQDGELGIADVTALINYLLTGNW